MKRALLFSLVALLFIVLPSCQEDESADWKLLNDQWFEAHKNDTGFNTTSSGLSYKVIHQGTQRFPNENSYVYAYYTGSLIDGTVFETDTLEYVSVSSLVEGWQEGLKKMQNGAKYILYIPSNLAYGTSTSNSSIPANSVLIFEIELVDTYNYDTY